MGIFNILQSSFAIGDLLGGFGGMLGDIDIVGIILGIIGEVFFLLDIFVVMALAAAILRGIFKKFWKVVWRSIVYVVLFLVFLMFSASITTALDTNVFKNITVMVGGTETVFPTLGALFTELVLQSGQTASYAEAMSVVLLKNVTMIIMVPAIVLIGNLVSMITYPLFMLLIPKKLKKLKLRVVKLALSVGMVLVVTILFAMPFANIVPALTDIKATMDPDSLLAAVFSQEIISVLEVFTKEKSISLKVLDSLNTLQFVSFFNNFKDAGTAYKLNTEMVPFVEALNTVIVS